MKTKKTKRLYLRLTQEEYSRIKARSEKFQSVSHYVMAAISEFSDSTVRDRQEAVKELTAVYSALDAKIGHLGGNLNQAMRHINQAAVAGIPTTPILVNSLLPLVRQCNDACIEIRKQLLDITINAAKRKR